MIVYPDCEEGRWEICGGGQEPRSSCGSLGAGAAVL